jgi:two-component SAPR family response regulator
VALQEFKPDFYDLMLVDIRMPKVNGFEFYHGVRKNDIKVKVCFITAFAISYEEISMILLQSWLQDKILYTNLLVLKN